MRRHLTTRARFEAEGSETIYGIARNLAHVEETDLAIVAMKRSVEGGLYAHQTFSGDAWLESIRSHSEFKDLVQLARGRSRAAAEDYVRAGGEIVLGVAPS